MSKSKKTKHNIGSVLHYTFGFDKMVAINDMWSRSPYFFFSIRCADGIKCNVSWADYDERLCNYVKYTVLNC